MEVRGTGQVRMECWLLPMAAASSRMGGIKLWRELSYWPNKWRTMMLFWVIFFRTARAVLKGSLSHTWPYIIFIFIFGLTSVYSMASFLKAVNLLDPNLHPPQHSAQPLVWGRLPCKWVWDQGKASVILLFPTHWVMRGVGGFRGQRPISQKGNS